MSKHVNEHSNVSTETVPYICVLYHIKIRFLINLEFAYLSVLRHAHVSEL